MSVDRRIELPDDILPRLRAREEAAYNELVERVGPSLAQMAAQMVRSSDTAKDIVQDVFYRVWEQGERFAPKGTVVAYLFTAVRNRALDLLKHERIKATSHDFLASEAREDEARSSAPSPDLELEVEEIRQQLDRVIATLSERQRTALALRYDYGLSIPEVAAILGVTVGGAKQLMVRIREILRDRLLGQGPGAE